MTEAIDHLSHEPAELILIHLGDVDRAGHADGWMGERQRRAHAAADRELARLFAALGARPAEESWALIITADHGGAGFSHHRGSLRETTIPWIVCGGGVVPAELPPVSLVDTARTIADILGLDFEPSTLHPEQVPARDLGLPIDGLWTTEEADRRGFAPERNGRWRRSLSLWQKVAAHLTLGAGLAELGYAVGPVSVWASRLFHRLRSAGTSSR